MKVQGAEFKPAPYRGLIVSEINASLHSAPPSPWVFIFPVSPSTVRASGFASHPFKWFAIIKPSFLNDISFENENMTDYLQIECQADK
jgi:hypothetical protein